MHKIRNDDGSVNIIGKKLKEYRLKEDKSIRDMAVFLQKNGLDWDKNAVNRTEQGARTVIDIEVRMLSQILKISCEELLDDKTEV